MKNGVTEEKAIGGKESSGENKHHFAVDPEKRNILVNEGKKGLGK